MDIQKIEQSIIELLGGNLEISGAPVPIITRDTEPLNDLPDFDSLRIVEIMVDLETQFDCELELDDFFGNPDSECIRVSEIAEIVKIKCEAKK